METRVSVEIGNQTIVAAYGSVSDTGVVKVVDSAMTLTDGYCYGEITDKGSLMHAIQDAVMQATKGASIQGGVIQFVMPKESVRTTECTVCLRGVKRVNKDTLRDAAVQCKKEFNLAEGEEIIDMIPSKLIVNGEESEKLFVERASEIQLTWNVYTVSTKIADLWMEIFNIFKSDSIAFVPYERACGEAFRALSDCKELAIVDLGAESERLLYFKGGMLKLSSSIRIGADSIDSDIAQAYKLASSDARMLKLSHGEALLYACQEDYVPLPDGINECKTKDLMVLIQCRLEELYEGVIFQLQQIGCNGGDVALVGGGNNLKNSDLLFKILSGMRIVPVKYLCQAKSETLLMVKEFAAAIGALASDPQDDKPVKRGWFHWL